jgi:diguanylate cyclase (GGDEF)-like protein
MLRVVTTAVRPTLIGALVFVLGIGGLLVWLLAYSGPHLTSARAGSRSLRIGEQAMFDEQDALRAYLATGEATFLESYRSAVSRVARATAVTERSFSEGDARVSTKFAQAWTAAQVWEDKWASPVASGSWRSVADTNADGTVKASEQTEFLILGGELFNRYRTGESAVQEAADSSVSSQIAVQTDGVTIVGFTAVLLGVASSTALAFGRRRLHRQIVAPIEQLSEEADRVAAGDYAPIQALSTGPVHEVAQLLTSLQGMTSSLVADREEATRRSEELLERTARLHHVLELSRELSASLSLSHVISGLTRAMRLVAGAAGATVWLQDWDQRTLTEFDSTGREGTERVEVGLGPVGRAAQYARTMPLGRDDSAGSAIPLVIGGRAVGVIAAVPLAGGELDMEMVDALALQGAAAIQAARMHTETEALSRRDPLTDLANRRQLTTDLAAEMERALRFGHTLSFVMIDLDHFKRLNDTYGHQRGDQVLREVAGTISREIRAIDGAYRYGGEELAILLREASGPEAVQTVERIRAAVASRFPWADEAPVTLSAGVAELDRGTTTTSTLIAAADEALYVAKRSGRNRVHLHDRAQPTRSAQRAG